MELMLDKKQIQAIFLFKCKMDHKAAETTCNINNAFGSGTANEHTVEWWFKRRWLQRRWVPWRWGVQWLVMRSWQRPAEMVIEADPLTNTWEVTEELSVNHPVVLQHLKQIGKVKKLNKWVPCELTKNKNCRFEVLSSLILCNNRPFLYWIVMRNKKWILFKKHWWWPAQWLDWEEDPKHFSMPNLHQKKKKKVMVTVWGSAVHLIHNSFLNPGETITSEKYVQQIDEIHWKLPCLQLALVHRKGPILFYNNAWPHVM